jgi:hypothetical protein
MNTPDRPHLFGVLAGLFLAGGLICSATVLTGAWLKISESQAIAVTGSARQNVRSDLIIWRGSFAVEDDELIPAQQKLNDDQQKVEAFFRAHNITNYEFTPIAIGEIQSRRTEDNQLTRTVGYRLTQTALITSPDVDRISLLGRETIKLVEQGVLFTPAPPEYIYTKAAEAKIAMLAEATRDARQRAEQIAAQGGRRLGDLRSAKMGVFQITPPFSRESSWDGVNDTSTADKTITSVVTASFTMK